MNSNAPSFDPSSYPQEQQQQQQQGGYNYYEEAHQATGYSSGMYGASSYGEGDFGSGDGEFYPSEDPGYFPLEHQSSGGVAYEYGQQPPENQYGTEQSYGGDWNSSMTTPAYSTPEVQPGCYYPDVQTPVLLPQVFGAPITAVAYDQAFDAMYVASASQSDRQQTHRGGGLLQERAAMMATHTATSGTLYSAVAGHPQAPATVLTTIYASIYNLNRSLPTNRRHVPSHAYRPPYASFLPSSLLEGHTKDSYQMGITNIVPLSGYVASVSPAAVRLHASGGMQVADLHVEGMLAATAHPHEGGLTTHVTVGGLVKGKRDSPLMCLDLYQGLRIASTGNISVPDSADRPMSVTALATSHEKGSIVAGCSDGFVRLYDGRLRFLAKIKSHAGGVVDVDVSQDGNLVATTGYGPSGPISSPLYAFPDPTVFLYDIRYLGRGGFPHPFAGMRGGPRHLSFLPDYTSSSDIPGNRLLVASGQAGAGMQILVPFEEPTSSANNFLLPPLERNESVSSIRVSDDRLAVGTSQGRVLQYKMAGHKSSSVSNKKATDGYTYTPSGQGSVLLNKSHVASGKSKEKQPLVMPSFHPPPPEVSIPASLLQTEHPNMRLGATDQLKSIISAFVMSGQPVVSRISSAANKEETTFGPLVTRPVVATSRLEISPDLVAKVAHTVDFLQTIPIADLELNIMEDHRPSWLQLRDRRNQEPLPNPNKLLYSTKLTSLVYKKTLNRRNNGKRRTRGSDQEDETGDEEDGTFVAIPNRYRLTMRPSHKSVATFNHGESNQTGFLPGWDYPPTMPNAFVPPVLMLLYFFPEVYALASEVQLSDRALKDKALVPELGGLFHRIDSVARFAMLFATEGGGMTNVGVWAPSNFISCLSTMPEAEQLQILDGSPEAIDSPRRPEAFFRFMLYQLDKESAKSPSTSKMLDSLSGISFTSVNEFISGSGPPSKSSTRAMTLDMTYGPFLIPDAKDEDKPYFCDVLQHNLCRETRLRAWNNNSKAYETIVQRKIATSLPSVLSLSCACAGRKEEEGLSLWRGKNGESHWLPEMIEIELDNTGLVVVRELQVDEKTGMETWKECREKGSIPASVSDVIAKARECATPTKRRYRLDAVIFMVRDDMDRNCPEEIQLDDGQSFGHHALHIRVPTATKRRFLEQQRSELQDYLDSEPVSSVTGFTKLGLSGDNDVLRKRLEYATARLAALEDEPSDSSWLLVNGYVVAETVVEDARAFHVPFKEPSLVVFRAIDNPEKAILQGSLRDCRLSTDVMKTTSITNNSKSPYASNQQSDTLPGRNELVAFDAEFVSVQDEESSISESGSKVTVRETRHALGRVSALKCQNQSVIFDDHVLPREPIVDYLTRFSGIVPMDLNPKQSPHHLINPWSAYLKLRCLLERGCVFVGHGLQQDFWTANLAVPDSQIIDTVDIYHKPAQRYISLRFLTNFVLKRDMQQDTHDSIEDAMAAYELYIRAVELKERGEFDKVLNDLYEYGQKTDWKLGMDSSEHDPNRSDSCD